MTDQPHDRPAPADHEDRWRQHVFSIAAWRRHAVWLAMALLTGAAALWFNYTAEAGGRLFSYLQDLSPLLPAAVVAGSMVLIILLRDRHFPGTEGTGIPQSIAALKLPDGPARDSVLSPRIAVGKTILLTLGLVCGTTIGREGPSVHVGACLMYWGSRLAQFPRHLVRRGLILAGGGAGIAAAFNAPIAGTVFAFEEIGKSFEKSNAGTILRTVAVAAILNIAFLSDYLFYGRMDAALPTVAAWLPVPLIGLLGGLLGGLFARAVAATAPHIARWNRARPYLVAGGLGLALAAIGLLSSGRSYGGGHHEAQAILMAGREFPVLFPLFKALASFVCLVSGIPGGLFDPSLTVGAGLGQVLGPLFPHTDPRAIILLMMAAYFAGVVQSPITAFAILVEMTGAHAMALPMLVAAVLAYGMSHLVCPRSLYEALAESFLRARGHDPAELETSTPQPASRGA